MLLRRLNIVLGSKLLKIKHLILLLLSTKTTLNSKMNEGKAEIPSINNLANTTALSVAENEIPDVSHLVKKTDYNTKVNEIEKKITDNSRDKYSTTPDFYNLKAGNIAAKLGQANLVTKTNFDDRLIKLNKKKLNQTK